MPRLIVAPSTLPATDTDCQCVERMARESNDRAQQVQLDLLTDIQLGLGVQP